MPGFLIACVFGTAIVRGAEDIGLAVGGLDGEDVPGIGGDDVGGDEVDLVGGVRTSVAVNGGTCKTFRAGMCSAWAGVVPTSRNGGETWGIPFFFVNFVQATGLKPSCFLRSQSREIKIPAQAKDGLEWGTHESRFLPTVGMTRLYGGCFRGAEAAVFHVDRTTARWREFLFWPSLPSAMQGSFDCGFASLGAKQNPRSG